ncbi:MAG: trypsin-like peptidase domain-containing protein [Rhizomicrobium sp.]
MNMRLPCIAALALALGLSACGTGSFGTPAAGFAFPQVGQSYIPLHKRDWMLATHDGASVVIAPGIAVTNAHNAGMIDPAAVIGRVEGYDLLYYRTAKNDVLPIAVPVNGEQVIAYGQDSQGKLRVSHGVVRQFWPAAFGYISDAGPGFSGGPVVDARTGALLGITYGYEGDPSAKSRLMVAYNMAFVMNQLAVLQGNSATQ